MKFIFFALGLLFFSGLFAQDNDKGNIDDIIKLIRELESQKDAKCYATANRLEDFMYGTPLTEEARNIRIDIQKKLVHYIRSRGSIFAKSEGQDSVRMAHIGPVVDSLVLFGRHQNGDFYFQLGDEVLWVKFNDFRQYSSVSYGYRALLSVEQDFLFTNKEELLPLGSDAIEPLYRVVNLMTLVTLQIADRKARETGARHIDSKDLIAAWLEVLSKLKEDSFAGHKYPEVDSRGAMKENYVLNKIIAQKLASYEAYNKLSATLFLRNIQVYFARQKWPVDPEKADVLKNYFLESMVAFCTALIHESEQIAELKGNALVRLADVQTAISRFTPFTANMFEDICFFPKLGDESITIEAYDLDAFRDSGWHWQVMSYSVDDISTNEGLSPDIDPHAAELIAESVAQMGVLVLRLAGHHSKETGKEVLDVDDLRNAFARIQEKINNYPEEDEWEVPAQLSVKEDNSQSQGKYFQDATGNLSVEYYHKSSDWLSRKIRSYVVSEDDMTIRLAIPPAFGGAGVAAEDINNDNYIDILLTGGYGNALYINDGTGRFNLSPLSENISVWNPEMNSYGEARQPLIADFDNDGYKDIFISYVNEEHRIYKNLSGEGFEEMTAMAALGGYGQVGGPATVMDFDNDGLLDIFIGYFGNYLDGRLPTLSRNNQNGDPNVLFRNLGDFRFEKLPPGSFKGKNSGWTQAVSHTDLNRDGLQDIIVGNDFGINEYYLNNGDGSFTDVAAELGTDKPSYTMNVGITDLNRDMFPDLYISNIVVMQKDEKYVSPSEDTQMKFDPEKMANIRTVEANDLFISKKGKINPLQYELSPNIGRGYSSTGWSWDADFFDYDNDGDEDLYCLNGMNDFSVYSRENPEYYISESGVIEYAQSNKEKNVFFENRGGYLINRADTVKLDLLSNARSAAYLDIENDGDLDIIVNNYHEEAVLLENKLSTGKNWIKIRLEGRPEMKVNRDAIGAVLVFSSENHKGIWREIHGSEGYLSVHPGVQHFGLGEDTEGDLLIIWPDGKEVRIEGLKSNNTYDIVYPDVVKN